jgi:Na+/proline symporter
VWTDVVQMSVYVTGGILTAATLLGSLSPGWRATASAAGKLQVLDFELGESFVAVLTSPYSFVTAVVGGAVFTLASHGVDQIIVQRLLACRDRRDATRALVTSGLIVIAQFALFLWIGVLLWAHHGGASLEGLGVSRADEIFPRFVISGLPAGISGILLAAIIAAAMSTLSSSLNSLANSSVVDLYQRVSSAPESRTLVVSRLFTLFWGILFIGFASLFTDQEAPVVELGLTIATFTYGGLLGSFLLGLLVPKSTEGDAMVAFLLAILLTVVTYFGVWHAAETGWQFRLAPTDAEIAAGGLVRIAWPWFTLIGAGTTVGVGWLLSLRRGGVGAQDGP